MSLISLENHVEKKSKWRKTQKTDYFEVDSISCAVDVSGRKSDTTRLYCCYPLTVEKGSVLYKALKNSDNSSEHFKFNSKEETEEGIHYNIAKRVKKFETKSIQEALDQADKFKYECQELKNYVSTDSYPEKLKELLPYCKAQSGNFNESQEAFLRTLTGLEGRGLTEAQEKAIRQAVKKIFCKEWGCGYCTWKMVAGLEIVPFGYQGSSTQFFAVNCTRFYIRMWAPRYYHFRLHTDKKIEQRLFYFVQDEKGKMKRFCNDNYAINDLMTKLATKEWDTVPLDSKAFFKAIASQKTSKGVHKDLEADNLVPGTILVANHKQVAVYLENNQIVKVAGKDEANDAVIFKFGILENFISQFKEFKQIKLNPNRFNGAELRERAVKLNEKEDYGTFRRCASVENAFYLVTGMRTTL